MSGRKIALLILPCLLLALSVALVAKRGPFHYGQNLDPEYIYLLNSVNLLHFEAPGHTDHPGTTLQELGAVAVLAQWLGMAALGGGGDLQASVLKHPEAYLRMLNFLLNCLFCGTVLLVSLSLWRRTNSLLPPLAFQIGLLMFREIPIAQTRMSPEPLLLTAALLLAWALLPAVIGAEPEVEASNPRRAFLAGTVFGFGLVTKVTFLPLAAMILAFPGWRQKGRFVTGAAVASLVLLLPVFSQLGRVAGWLSSLLTHQGQYGSGRTGLPEAGVYFRTLYTLLRDEPSFPLLLAVCAIALFAAWLRPAGETRPLQRFLTGALLSAAGLLAITAKHYGSHYVLPAIMLAPVSGALVLWMVLQIQAAPVRRALLVVSAAAVAAGLFWNLESMGRWVRHADAYRRNVAAQLALVTESKGCVAAGVYRSSLLPAALHFGNGFARGRHWEALDRIYPDTLLYSAFAHQFESFDFTPKDNEVHERLQQGGCVLVQGELAHIKQMTKFQYDVVGKPAREAVVRIGLLDENAAEAAQ